MYILEGNIGVGKSTFLSLLKEYLPEIEIITEPLDDWNKQTYGQSLLENFYNDAKRWAYTLETLTMICRSKYHIQEQKNKNPNRVMERSIYSGHYCFARNSYESGFMTKMEWEIYNGWVDFLLHKHCRSPLGFIYLKADPKICFERMQKRNRFSEKNLSIDYMKKIDHWHDSFLVEKKGVSKALISVPVLVLDCNRDFESDVENMRSQAELVKAFMLKTQAVEKSKSVPSQKTL